MKKLLVLLLMVFACSSLGNSGCDEVVDDGNTNITKPPEHFSFLIGRLWYPDPDWNLSKKATYQKLDVSFRLYAHASSVLGEETCSGEVTGEQTVDGSTGVDADIGIVDFKPAEFMKTIQWKPVDPVDFAKCNGKVDTIIEHYGTEFKAKIPLDLSVCNCFCTYHHLDNTDRNSCYESCISSTGVSTGWITLDTDSFKPCCGGGDYLLTRFE